MAVQAVRAVQQVRTIAAIRAIQAVGFAETPRRALEDAEALGRRRVEDELKLRRRDMQEPGYEVVTQQQSRSSPIGFGGAKSQHIYDVLIACKG